jgi:hypothetical protein
MRSTLFVFANGFAADEAVLTDGAEGERHASASQAVAFSPAAIATGEYPNVARFAEMGVEPSNDDSFERGLRGVLDGIATDIQACTTKPVKALTKPKGSRSRACLTSSILSGQRQSKFPDTRSSRGCGKSGNPALFAGFPSSVGKSGFWTFPLSVFFHSPSAVAFSCEKHSHPSPPRPI